MAKDVECIFMVYHLYFTFWKLFFISLTHILIGLSAFFICSFLSSLYSLDITHMSAV